MSLEQADAFAMTALEACGTSHVNARAMTDATLDAELSAMPSHGFLYVPIYCEHVLHGKVDGKAIPSVTQKAGASFVADAKSGFAHPAINAGFAELVPAARDAGIAALAVTNSYNCALLGFHTRRLAEAGLVGIGFTNSPASIAPVGGSKKIIGTNPLSFAVPGEPGEAIFVLDQSSSVIAKSELMKRRAAGEPIPEGWALDPDGNPTTDPELGIQGTMVPMGAHKGFGQGLMVEVLAAAVSGSVLGMNSSSFGTNEGGPTNTGQFFMAIAPEVFSGDAFASRIGELTKAITDQPGARLPGSRRAEARSRIAADGITIPAALHERILGYL